MVISKLVCKRTFFRENVNYFKVCGKKYGELYVAFEKNKIYNYREALQWEIGLMYCSVESEWDDYWLPVSKEEFEKYFKTLDEVRDEKINTILK